MADVYNTTVNMNGKTVFSGSYSLGNCCCYGGGFMNSCFGFGYPMIGGGIGFGVGMMAGAALVPALPSIFKGIGQGFAWLGTKVIAPAAVAVYKGAILPFYKHVLAPVGNAIGDAATWFAKKTGITKLWHKIFPKKEKSESKKAE